MIVLALLLLLVQAPIFYFVFTRITPASCQECKSCDSEAPSDENSAASSKNLQKWQVQFMYFENVDVEGYEPDFYGEMNDGINSGDRTDRVFAWWRLESPRAIAASAGGTSPLEVDRLVSEGRDVITITTPRDIVEIRMTDTQQALQWRMQMRGEFTEAYGNGYRVIGIDAQGSYVLEGAHNDD